ncbi:MAG: NAD(P)H-binding protein [Chloroflexi bacterium]|nr:NAD(P)H-binding protein [Chloroflexota bacterium]
MILITGGTGFVGRQLVGRLLDEGIQFRLLLSSRSAVDRLPEGDYETVTADIEDPDALQPALKDVHTIVHLIGTEARGRHHRLWEVDVPGTKALIEAAQRARAGRIIVLSRPGASTASAYTVKQAKGEIEEAVRRSGLAYTIFRVNVLFGEGDRFSEHIAMLARVFPVYFLPGDGETVLEPLWVNDLVTCLAIALEDLDLIDRVMDLGGPEVLTYRRIVLRVMQAVGTRRPLLSLPYLIVRFGGWFLDGLFARWPFTEMWADLLAANQTTEAGNIERHFGFRPAAFDIGLIDKYLNRRGYLWQFIRYIFTTRW